MSLLVCACAVFFFPFTLFMLAFFLAMYNSLCYIVHVAATYVALFARLKQS